jgi:PAS domain S-box-containing protein
MRQNRKKMGFGIPLPSVVSFILFEASYLLAYRFGMSFTQNLSAPFWFPDSVLLAALLATPSNTWWIYILGTMPIRFFLVVPPELPFWFLLASFANDSLKAFTSAWLLRRSSRKWVWFDSLREFAKYLLVAVLFVPMASALAGAASRAELGFLFWPAWKGWFVGDSLANLALTPLLLCLLREYRQRTRQKTARYVEALMLLGGLIPITNLALRSDFGRFGHPPFLFYLPVPLLLWAAVSFGPLGTSGALFIVDLLAILGTIDGSGPLRQDSPDSGLLSIQLFVFFVSLPFMFLAVIMHQQRKTEAALRESEERFRSLANTAPVMIWLTGTDSQCTFFNRPWLDFTGRSIEDEIGNGWMHGVHPADRESCGWRYLTAFASRETFTNEYRLLRHDGVYRWVLNRGVPRYAPEGVFLGYIGSCVDLTDRKEAEEKLRELSFRLIHAQEAERFRIGQQLHDDLAQRALAVSVGLTRLERKCDDSKLERELRKLHKQTLDICKEIANVSYQLRPATLERLGLPIALRSLCEQATTDKSVILFVQKDDLPPLTQTASVSLYRIAQEALRNALTHSGAACIDVELSTSDSALLLSITDNGCGFILETATKTSLGLSGMAERMKNLGGELTIRSSPGQGTTITATIPMQKALAASLESSAMSST